MGRGFESHLRQLIFLRKSIDLIPPEGIRSMGKVTALHVGVLCCGSWVRVPPEAAQFS